MSINKEFETIKLEHVFFFSEDEYKTKFALNTHKKASQTLDTEENK